MKTINTTEIHPAIPLLITRPAPACLVDAFNKPAPKMLLNELWHEGELSVLFGNGSAGKSLLAVQAAEAISTGTAMEGFKTEISAQKVLYFDFDTSDYQFAQRYFQYTFSDNLIRVTINREHCELKKFGEQLFAGIESAVKQHGAKVIIIDSLCTLKYFVNDLFFLTRLLQLKNRMNLSVLLLAGTKKSAPGRPLTLGNLAANKMLAGIADSVFAIGTSKSEENGRYLVHLKGRELGCVYNQHRVIIGRNTFGPGPGVQGVTPVTGLPGFEFTGYGTEQQQLVLPPEGLDATILEFRCKAPNASLGEIASWAGTNKMKVKRVLERYAFTQADGTSQGARRTPLRGSDEPLNQTSKSGVRENFNPFRGGVEPTYHFSQPGVNNPPTDSRLRGNDGLPHDEPIRIPSPQSNATVEALNSAPLLNERGSDESLNQASKSGVRENFNPFRGGVEPTYHSSQPGVNNPPTDSRLRGNDCLPHDEPIRIPSPRSNATVEALNSAPLVERGSDEPLNQASKSGVRENFNPFRGGVEPTYHFSQPGANNPPTDSRLRGNDGLPHDEPSGHSSQRGVKTPINTAVTVVTHNEKPGISQTQTPHTEPQQTKPLTYGQQLKKRLAQVNSERRAGKK